LPARPFKDASGHPQRLVEARRLYARLGYREVPPFNAGQYAEHWFEKTLT